MDQVTPPSHEPIKSFWRGIGQRQVRLVCGLVLFTYLISHFLNHALGNISLDAMAEGVYYHTLFWQFPPMAIVFYTRCCCIPASASGRCTSAGNSAGGRWSRCNSLLGLSIPADGRRPTSSASGSARRLYAQEKLYPQELYLFWTSHQIKDLQISAVLTIAWVHGCIGLYFWLRMKAWFKLAAPWLLAAAVLVPTLALLGFYQAGRDRARP